MLSKHFGTQCGLVVMPFILVAYTSIVFGKESPFC